jgi:hypothetical protein
MAKELAPDILLFGQDDQEFVEWCHANHDGFVWNCVRDAAGIFPFMLHAAIRNGDLCQHFRNSKRASGYEANLELVPSSAFFATLVLCYKKYFLVVQWSPACARIDG